MILYGINTFLWASPFRTEHLRLPAKGKALGFDLVEIPIEGEKDIDYAKAAEAYRRTGLQMLDLRGHGRRAATPPMRTRPSRRAASPT